HWNPAPPKDDRFLPIARVPVAAFSMASAAPPASLLLRARPRTLSLPHPAAAVARPALDGSESLRRAPRRLFLGIGVSFLDRFARMASGSGGRSFGASARPQRGVSPVEQVSFTILKNVVWPEKFPFKDEDFTRFDEYASLASCFLYFNVSHYPAGYRQDRIVGMGMNEEELKRNPVSVDYLTKPIDVFKEMQRILKPGGLAIMSFSNRCFWTKAISIWTSTGDADHAWIVGAYFHYAGGFEPPAVDISPNPGRSDPMYVVYSRKLTADQSPGRS
ncbi:hypothetical protein BHE74_00029107, partial [Ensete ventricosum]